MSSENDPGGGSDESSGSGLQPQNIVNLQESFSKQQAKISALKELVRKSEQSHGKSVSSTHEKVKNIAQRLTHIKSKARYRHNLDRSASEFRDEPIFEESISRTEFISSSSRDLSLTPIASEARIRAETPGSEKFQLLRLQMEKNKLKMAQREHSKREIEEMVINLKAQFDSTQQSLERSSTLGRSMGDLSSLCGTNLRDKFKSDRDLSFTPINLDKEKIKFLENRVKHLEHLLEREKDKNTELIPSEQHARIMSLENKILDLEENLREKESIIDARTQAVSLMSENLSMKSKTTVDTLEDTRQEMFKMQNSFIDTEDALKDEIHQLRDELEQRELVIKNLQEVNDILETARFDLTVKNAEIESKLADVQDYSTKLSEINKVNETLQNRISDLESQKYEFVSTEYFSEQVGTEYVQTIEKLSDRLKELETENDDLKKLVQNTQTEMVEAESTDENVAAKISTLEATIFVQREEIKNLQLQNSQLEEQLSEKTVECNVLNANFSVLQEKLKVSAPKSLFSQTTDEEAEIEINKLKGQLDEANKSMIKTKLKVKQLQKQVDSFKKISDVNAELIRLKDVNQSLQQKITELEEEKGSLQLHIVSGEVNVGSDDELVQKIQILETTCQNQTTAIQLLEEQKLDMTENLQTAKHELASLKDQMSEIETDETARVSSQIKSVQLEEQLDDKILELKSKAQKHEKEFEELQQELGKKDVENQELTKKLDHYVAENIELLDKLEKLSKSSSSAESIEIVENLTHQEKLEIEAFNKKMAEEHDRQRTESSKSTDEHDNSSAHQELSENLIKLREESSELQRKIELFTNERREVLEKMEVLNTENQFHMKKISDLQDEKLSIEENCRELLEEKANLEVSLEAIRIEKDELLSSLKEISEHRDQVKEDMNVLLKEKRALQNSPEKKPIVITPNLEGLEICEQSLTRLQAELETFRKADKNSRINISKKLAKEAKNVHQQIGELFRKLKDVVEKEDATSSSKENLDDVQQKCSEMENLVQKLNHDIDGKNTEIDGNKRLIDELNSQIDTLKENVEEIQEASTRKEETLETQIEHLKADRKLLDAKVSTSTKEIEILKTLVAEQKQQLIQSYTEHEDENSVKLGEIKNLECKIELLQTELQNVQSHNANTQDAYFAELKNEIKTLKAVMSSNSELLDAQIDELKHKQDTIETLNGQIMDLYKTMEENSLILTGKDEEISKCNTILKENEIEIERLKQENVESKFLMEKLLQELHERAPKTSKDNEKEDKAALEERVSELEMKISTQQSDLFELEGKNSELETLNSELAYKSSDLEAKTEDLESNIAQLKFKNENAEKQNSDLEKKNKDQLEKLKKFAANLKKKVTQCIELEEKLKTVTQSVPVDSAHKLQDSEEVEALKNKIDVLKSSLIEMESIKIDSNTLSFENGALKAQLERKTHELQVLNDEVEGFRQETAAKIAAKDEEIQEIRHNYCELQNLIDHLKLEIKRSREEWNDERTQLHEKFESIQLQIRDKDAQIKAYAEDITAKNIKFEKCKAVIKEKNREIQRLNGEKENLSGQLKTQQEQVQTSARITEFEDLRKAHARLLETYEQEKITFQQTIQRLETVHDGIQAKLQEDMGYIESLETENNKFKDKIVKLENCIANFEERRASLERQTNLLDAQLHQKTDEFEEKEDALIYRLNMLSDHDDVIGKRLLESQEENDELSIKNNQLKEENSELILKLAKLEKDFENFRKQRISQLEGENSALQEQLSTTRNELSKLQATYDSQKAAKNAEFDELENELSIQLQKMETEKRHLLESLEKSRDEINELKDETVRLRESNHSLEQIKNDLEREMTWIKMQNDNLSTDQMELQELRIQLIQDKTEIENQKQQMDSLIQNHEIELNALRTQITELDSMRMQVGQNQTDDQVFIETENKRLKDLLAERDAAIESYQRQNMQLQMAGASSSSNLNDPFNMFGESTHEPQENVELIILREKLQKLEGDILDHQQSLTHKEETLNKTTRELNDLKQELRIINTNNSDLQKLCLERQNEVSNLRQELERAKRSANAMGDPVPQNFFTEQGISSVPSSFFADVPASTSSIFDDIIVSRHVDVVEGGVSSSSSQQFQQQTQSAQQPQNQRTIEDLERNVSDLEKYATDLENKLKNLTNHQEEIVAHSQESVRKYEETNNSLNIRLKELENKIRELEAQKNVESLIVDQSHAPTSGPSLGTFFQASMPQFDFDQLVRPIQQLPSEQIDGEIREPIPIEEEIIVPKKTYVCQPEGATTASVELGEGWAWGSDEAVLEESHQTSQSAHSLSLVPASAGLLIKLQECEDKIHELNSEHNQLKEKYSELQTKSAKLLKKLKEYKNSNEKLQASQNTFKKSPSVESSDLDLAIQEELNSQVKNLEEKLTELKKLNEKAQLEKENLLKRVDVLTAANERMTELKERQDIEVEVHQTKIRQLSQNLQRLEEYGNGNEKTSSEPAEKTAAATNANAVELVGRVQELEKQLLEVSREAEDLKIDRDELQELLEEEEKTVKSYEKEIKALEEKILSHENESSDRSTSEQNVNQLALKVQQLETEVQTLRSDLSSKETDVSNLKLKNQDLETRLNDYKWIIDQLSSESGAISAHLYELRAEHQQKLEENEGLSLELQSWIERNERLSKEIEAVRSANSSNREHVSEEQENKIQDLNAQLQYKEAAILHLKQKVEDVVREDQTQSLVQEILVKNQEITSLKEKVRTLEIDKTDLKNNLSIQLTKELSNRAERDSIPHSDQLATQISTPDKKSGDLQSEKESHEHEIDVEEQEDRMKQVALELDMKNIEIAELKNSLEFLRKQNAEGSVMQVGEALEQSLQQQQQQFESIIEQRCHEVAESWRKHLSEVEQNYRQEIERLQSEQAIQESPEKPAQELSLVPSQQSSQDETDSELVEKMQTALEAQELEIVTLKEQLAIRSAEYARLAAQHDPYGQQTSSSSAYSMPQKKTSFSNEGVVSKSEYDLSLYMLHQRDMKCEELTLELLHLLEERDTLQLKLSNSLRAVEEIKRKTGFSQSGSESELGGPSTTNSPEKQRTHPIDSTTLSTTDSTTDRTFFPTDSSDEASRQSEKIKSKLSQLHKTSQIKDKQLKDERIPAVGQHEQRHIELIQEDVARIPSEAVSQLVGQDLTTTTQSPSTVLLNWLWGKSGSNNNNQQQQS